MQIPHGDLAPRRSHAGWPGYRRRHAVRRRALFALLLVLVLGASAYAGTRWFSSDTVTPVDRACGTGTPSAAPSPAPPDPAAFRVRVLNATARDGLAATAAAGLAQRGFRVSGTGNAPPPPGRTAPPTAVRFGPGGSAPARVVAEQVGPGVPVAPDPSVRGEVVLVIGPDFSRLATPAEIAAGRAARTAAATTPSCPPAPEAPKP